MVMLKDIGSPIELIDAIRTAHGRACFPCLLSNILTTKLTAEAITCSTSLARLEAWPSAMQTGSTRSTKKDRD